MTLWKKSKSLFKVSVVIALIATGLHTQADAAWMIWAGVLVVPLAGSLAFGILSYLDGEFQNSY